MTDVNPSLSIDPADFMRRWADHEKRSAELHPANKASLFAALRQAAITSVVVTFDGEGDSGQIESIDAKAGDLEAELPVLSVDIAVLHFSAKEPERLSQPLSDAIETLAYAYLEQSHGGWENNAGAFGEFVFDVATGTITLDYNERFEDSELTVHTF